MSKLIKLVSDKDNKRALLFEDLLKDLNGYSTFGRITKKPSSDVDLNILFNFNSLEDLKDLRLFNPQKKTSPLFIYDISKDLFRDPEWGPIVYILVASCNYLTCSSEYLQFRIYEETGRLARIIKDPLSEQDIEEPIEVDRKNALWYGDLVDIFSVRNSKSNKLTIGLTSGYLSGDNIKTINSSKKKESLLSKFNIIYLPPTSNLEGEVRRAAKIEECTKLGKIIIEKSLAKRINFDELLTNAKEAQKEYFKTSSKEYVQKEFKTCLDNLEVEDYLSHRKQVKKS